MRKLLIVIFLFLSLLAKEFVVNELSDFLISTPGSYWFGLYGFDNPALLTYMDYPDILILGSTGEYTYKSIENYGIFFGSKNFGLGYFNSNKTYWEYRISSAFGNRKLSIGTGFGINNENNRLLTIGGLIRPNRLISTGVYYFYPLNKDPKTTSLDIGVRPFKNEVFTLFGSFSIKSNEEFGDSKWNIGGIIEPIKGIRFSAYFDKESRINVGISLSLGNIGFTYKNVLSNDLSYIKSIYGMRMGMQDRTFFSLPTSKKYIKLDLYGELKYQRYKYFDKSNTLFELLKFIEDAKNDNSVKGVAINTSGMSMDIEKIWEIREKLKDFKKEGKKVIIYLDNAGLFEYYLASCADKIILDPEGIIELKGIAFGRTYIKNALDKIGIGVDELRFFKYKSAAETFSREKMSDADREQHERLVDVIYEYIRKDICEGRKISFSEFDRIVDEDILILPSEALEKNLVDTILRYDKIDEYIKILEGKKFTLTKHLPIKSIPKDYYWGEKPKIAIIYAIGACAMDEGITSRKLIKDLEWAINNKDVKGIILRVDSPGGDVLASDIIAEGMKKGKGKKPIIVSQGLVAASGGYWISMYGDKILSSPFTITGSIGVIGVWIYNNGFKERLGISTDLVKRGEHSDMGYPFIIPFINFGLPDRGLDPYERKIMEKMIRSLYNEFITKVSNGRNKEINEVDSIAQGRVWTGVDAEKIGLVDILGGLEDAIQFIKEKANIKDDYEIIELPYPKSFNFNMFTPKLINEDGFYIEELKFRAKYNGKPLLILPIEDIELLRMLERGDR